MREPDDAYRDRIATIHRRLRIPEDYAESFGLPLQKEADELADAGPDVFGRPTRLAPDALRAWGALARAAAGSSVELLLVSGFRSVDYQEELIGRKLAAGRTLDQILCVNAAPGYSEHHTGVALDLATPGCEPLVEAFESTAAFAWLCEHAAEFGFQLSYPRDHPSRVDYEPWHWALQAGAS